MMPACQTRKRRQQKVTTFRMPAPCCAKRAKGLTCGALVANRDNNSRIQTKLKKTCYMGIPWDFPWEFLGISMGFSCDFHGISMRFPWVSCFPVFLVFLCFLFSGVCWLPQDMAFASSSKFSSSSPRGFSNISVAISSTSTVFATSAPLGVDEI